MQTRGEVDLQHLATGGRKRSRDVGIERRGRRGCKEGTRGAEGDEKGIFFLHIGRLHRGRGQETGGVMEIKEKWKREGEGRRGEEREGKEGEECGE